MKKSIFLWLCALVLTIAGLSSCSSDDDDVFVPKDKDYVGYVMNKTGTVCYDAGEESWYILIDLPPLPNGAAYYDSAILYYTYSLPKAYQQNGLRVTVSGSIYDYEFHNEPHYLGGHEYYYIVLSQIGLTQ